MVRLTSALLLPTLIATAPGCGEAAGGEGDGQETVPQRAEGVAPWREPEVQRPGPGTGTPTKQWGPLVVEPGGYDLGFIGPDAVFETEFTLFNPGDEPINVTDTTSDCACTVPESFAGTVIPAGGRETLEVTFSGPSRPGPKTSKLYVKFTGGGGDREQGALIKITGTVSLPIRAEPPYVDALEGKDSGTVRIRALDGRPFRVVTAFGGAPVYAGGFDPGADEPRAEYVLRWDLDYPDPPACEGLKLWWVVETDHPDCPVLPLRIRHECTGVRADPAGRQRGWVPMHQMMVNLGAIRPGETVETDVPLRVFSGPTEVRSVESLSPDATAELVTTWDPPGEKYVCRVRFRVREGYEGLLHAPVALRSTTGDGEMPFLARVVNDRAR